MDAKNNSKIIRFRHCLARWIAPDLIWNPDMSREIDHLVLENDRLRERIKVVEDRGL